MHGQLGLASDLEVFWFAKQFNLIVVCKIFIYKNKNKNKNNNKKTTTVSWYAVVSYAIEEAVLRHRATYFVVTHPSSFRLALSARG